MYKLSIKTLTALLCIYFAKNSMPNYQIAIVILIGLSVSFAVDIIKPKYKTLVYTLFFITSTIYPVLIFSYPIVFMLLSELPIPAVLAPIIAFIIIGNFKTDIVLLSLIALLTHHLINKYNTEKIQGESEYFKVKLEADKQKIEKIKSMENLEKDIEIAILSERNRIAREIYDSVGHTISGAIIQSEAMRGLKDKSLNKSIDSLQTNLKSGMADIRTSLHALHDKSIDLHLAISDVIQSNTSLDITLNYSVDSILTYNVKHDILSVIKEAISNTIKHSNAKTMHISIIEMPKHLSISIEDNDNKLREGDIGKRGIGFYSFENVSEKYQGRFTYEYQNGIKLLFLLNKESCIDRSK